jgi:hypothetical protein
MNQTITNEFEYVKYLLKQDLNDSWKNVLVDWYVRSDQGKFIFQYSTYRAFTNRSTQTLDSTLSNAEKAGIIDIQTMRGADKHSTTYIIAFNGAP